VRPKLFVKRPTLLRRPVPNSVRSIAVDGNFTSSLSLRMGLARMAETTSSGTNGGIAVSARIEDLNGTNDHALL
jgi:hypothetical protein